MAERPIAEGTIRFSPDMRSLANVEKSVKKAIGRIETISARGGLLSKNYVQPLGQITGAADEFTKSLEASNARVIAFGASAGIIYNVQRALTASVGAAIDLEKKLADINVILNESNAGLQRFSNELFNIAKGTGQSFQAVADAGLEFARQGLAVEETLKRTRDAMILVRLSGLDVQSSVESITATMNSFNQTVITSTELVNKLANVDAAFAVSSADLAEAIRRVGSSAQDSNVNIDQLIALVTTAQQVTARGGSVIGNSLKTIFTRLQRPQVIADLEAFGIAVRDQQGAMMSTMQILQSFANTYDQLAPSQKAVTAELVGGVFQINVLKAALGDLGKQYSIYDRALNVSLTSTNQAIARNELLNKTLSTLINETMVNVQKVGAAFANLTVTPALTNILEAVNSSVEKLEEKAAQGDLGVTFGKGILQGLSNVLSGPALIAIAGILAKLTFSFFKFSTDAVKTFAGLNTVTNQQKEVQLLIQNLLIKNPSLIASATSSAEGLKMVETEILKIIQTRNLALKESAQLSSTIGRNISIGDIQSLNASANSNAAKGFVPNYNRKNEQAEVMGALQGGYTPGRVDTMQIQGVGRVTYNQAEEVKQFPGMSQPAIMPPQGSDAGKAYASKFKQTHGFNPYNEGHVPNFAAGRKAGDWAGVYNFLKNSKVGAFENKPSLLSALNNKDFRLNFTDATLGMITNPNHVRHAGAIKALAGGSDDPEKLARAREKIDDIKKWTKVGGPSSRISKHSGSTVPFDAILTTLKGLRPGQFQGMEALSKYVRNEVGAESFSDSAFKNIRYLSHSSGQAAKKSLGAAKYKQLQGYLGGKNARWTELETKGKAGQDFEKMLSEYLGVPYKKDAEAMDYGLGNSNPLPVDEKLRAAIQMRSDYNYGDAHVSTGHQARPFASKIIRDADRDGKFSRYAQKVINTKGQNIIDLDRVSPKGGYWDIMGGDKDREGVVKTFGLSDFRKAAKPDTKKILNKLSLGRGRPPRIQYTYNRDSVKLASGGFIPNLQYGGLRDEDLGDSFINVNPNNKGKSIDHRLSQKEITKRIGGKTVIRGPEGETLVVGGDLEGRAGSITVGGLSARKIKKANPKYQMMLDNVPGLFDGLAYQILGAVGAKFDAQGASGAMAGVKFEQEFAEAHGLPAAGAKKGSDFIVAEKMAQQLGTQKHLQLKLSVFEKSKRDVKKVVDVASSFSKYLVDILTNNIKTQGLSKLVGPERFRAAMGVLNKNPALKSQWSGYFGKMGTMSQGYVPNFAQSALKQAIGREMGAGYSRGQVKVGYDSRLAASGGIGVYNTTEGSLTRAVNLHKAGGKSMSQIQTQGASFGHIPNFETDLGDFAGAGLSMALLAPAISSFSQSLKDARDEKARETKAIADSITARAKADKDYEKLVENQRPLKNTEARGKAALDIGVLREQRDRLRAAPDPTRAGLLAGKEQTMSRQSIQKSIDRGVYTDEQLTALGLIDKKGRRKGVTEKGNRSNLSVAQFEENFKNLQTEVDTEEKQAREERIAAINQEAEQIRKNSKNSAEFSEEDKKARAEAHKARRKAQQEQARQNRAQKDARDGKGNRLASKFGTTLAFGAPMLAGMGSNLFQAAGGSATTAAGINALGTGIGTAGAFSTAAGEVGENIRSNEGLQKASKGRGTKATLARGALKAARFAGPAAAIAGGIFAIDKALKAAAKAKIQQKANEVNSALEAVSGSFNRVQQSGQQFMESFDKLQNALNDPLGANAGDIQRVQNNLATALSDAPTKFREQIKAAGGDAEKIRQIFSEITLDLQKQQAALTATKDIFELQAKFGAGGGIAGFFGAGDTTIFEDDAEGKKAFAAAQAASASGLDRSALATALEAGRRIDFNDMNLVEEFFSKEFAGSVEAQSDEDRKKLIEYFNSIVADTKEAVRDAGVVAKDLKERQDREKAYQKQVKTLNDEIRALTASLASAVRQTEASIITFQNMANSFSNFQLQFAKADVDGAGKLAAPFLSKTAQARQETQLNQLQIRSDSLKALRDIISSGTQDILKVSTKTFAESAQKLEQSASTLQERRSKENEVNLERQRSTLEALGPIVEGAFAKVAADPNNTAVLDDLPNQIEAALKARNIPSEKIAELTKVVESNLQESSQKTTDALKLQLQKQDQMLRLEERQAYWAEESVKLQERIASFGGPGDFLKASENALSSNFDKLASSLDLALKGAASGNAVDAGRAQFAILDNVINGLGMSSIANIGSGIAPMLGGAIAGRSLDLQQQIGFSGRLMRAQGFQGELPKVDTDQLATEQIFSQLKLNELPDSVDEIRKNTAALNRLIERQGQQLVSKNSEAFDKALKANGMQNLSPLGAAALVTGENNVRSSNFIGNVNVTGFGLMRSGLDSVNGTLGVQSQIFSSTLKALGQKALVAETASKMRTTGDALAGTKTAIAAQDSVVKFRSKGAANERNKLKVGKTMRTQLNFNERQGKKFTAGQGNTSSLDAGGADMLNKLVSAQQLSTTNLRTFRPEHDSSINANQVFNILLENLMDSAEVGKGTIAKPALENARAIAKQAETQFRAPEGSFTGMVEMIAGQSGKQGSNLAVGTNRTIDDFEATGPNNTRGQQITRFNQSRFASRTALKNQALSFMPGTDASGARTEFVKGGREVTSKDLMFDANAAAAKAGLALGQLVTKKLKLEKERAGLLEKLNDNSVEQFKIDENGTGIKADNIETQKKIKQRLEKQEKELKKAENLGGANAQVLLRNQIKGQGIQGDATAGRTEAGLPASGLGTSIRAMDNNANLSVFNDLKLKLESSVATVDSMNSLFGEIEDLLDPQIVMFANKEQKEFLELLKKQVIDRTGEIEEEDKNKKLLDSLTKERKKQLELLKSLNGVLNEQAVEALLNLQREREVRKVLDANANAIRDSITSRVRMGDPEKIQEGILSNAQAGLSSLIGPDSRNVQLSKDAEKVLTDARAGVVGRGVDTLNDFNVRGEKGNKRRKRALEESGGDPLAAAEKLLAQDRISQKDFDKLSKQMQSDSKATSDTAAREINRLTATAVQSTTSRLLAADPATKTSDDFVKNIEARFADFEKKGTELSDDDFNSLRQKRNNQLDDETKRARDNASKQRKLDEDDSKRQTKKVIGDQKAGLATEQQITAEIAKRFKEFKELGTVFDASKIQELRTAQKSQRGEEFSRELQNLKKQKQFSLEDVETNISEAQKKVAEGLLSASQITQVIGGSVEEIITKGGDLTKVASGLKALSMAGLDKQLQETNSSIQAFALGIGNINQVMTRVQENINNLILNPNISADSNQVADMVTTAKEANDSALGDYERQFEVTKKLYEGGAVSLDFFRAKIKQLNEQAMKTGDYDFGNFLNSIRDELTYGNEQYFQDIDSLGREFTRDFKSGMGGAFGEAIKGTKKLKDAFSDMMADMADKLLDRSLDIAVNSAFGALGFKGFNKGGLVKGYNSGGVVKGGSGIKDDVPAYLSRGEYVIRKSTVNEYGKDFFDSLNSAKVIAANRGGMIDNTKLTRGSADMIFGNSARNMAALEAEKQKRISALQRAGITAYGYKEATNETKKDWLGRDTGQKVLANRIGFELDFGKPLTEDRVKKIQSAVNSYPEIGPFIDPDIFKRSTVQIGKGSSRLKLKNSFIYNETKRPTQGRFVADPRLSSLALNDENNPQNKYKFEKADKFFDYQKNRLEYYADKQKELEEFQEQKSNKRRSFLFGAGALLFAGALGGGRGFAKGGMNKEDDIPALLTGGEYVVRKGIVDKYGLNFFENLNRGRISAFNKGGYVAPITGARNTTALEGGRASSSAVDSASTTNNVNISVNIDNAGAVTTDASQDGSRNTSAASQEESKQLANRIKGAVMGVIAEQKRPGGMLYGTPGSV